MRLAILGGPGSGKSTQLQRLCIRLGIPGISVGDILRQAIASGSFLGRKAQPYVESGELIPDDLMIQLMRLRLLQDDARQGWLLEGYPRTAFQAEELDFVLADFGQQLERAIYLELDAAIMRERARTRARADDQAAIIERRIYNFQEQTLPLLAYYEPRQKLLRADAAQSPAAVEQEILQKLNA
ncbi:MAG: nucleoside monophosphate kinase [Spirulinaceae cyanobacterium SM2_1_0]|nr:nucleoside monophosphate kinase [Spirulinaceae cyanobacterium SM2_1_0]